MNILDNLEMIVSESRTEAKKAANEYLEKYGDRDCCGFAWVAITEYNGKKIRGNSKIAKKLEELGINQDYTRAFIMWNPSQLGVQSLNVLEAGAREANKVFRKYGFTSSINSRMD